MKQLLLALLLLFSLSAFAKSPNQPIPADQAFQFSAMAKDNQTIIGLWNIKSGFYLYRDRIHFSSLKPSKDRLGQPLWPEPDTVKDYPGIGKLPVYAGQLKIAVPVIKAANQTIYLKVNYQGCSDQGYCYPPTSKTVAINLAGDYGQPAYPLTIDIAPEKAAIAAAPATEQDKVTQLLEHKNLFIILLSFLGFGLLLSLTPCVLPMIPILSGIIAGQQKHHHIRAFSLSLAYVLGMAITYAIAGVIFGFIGGTVQAAFQKPWLIVLFSLIFVAMALSLFGFYNIQLPQRWQARLTELSNRQRHGTYLGTAMMGCLSTLILSPCVTPALVGVLGYISQTGNAALGGIALFVMGLGMGVPLLLIGAFSTKFLPKAGSWMNTIKYILGFLMLAVAIWMLARILPSAITVLLWAALTIGAAIALKTFSTTLTLAQKIGKSIGIVLFIYGIILIIGALSGNANPLYPFNFAFLRGERASDQSEKFIPVYTLADVKQQLSIAKTQGKPIMIDFYADWCISCKQMDLFTFSNKDVQKALTRYRLLRADVTRNDPASNILESHFNVVAPPTILFLNPQGKEIPNSRIVGEMSASKFLNHLQRIK